ncbi:cell division protein FtsX [bacterium]|nr:cell division protein FtsX [bacterium]
MTAGPLLPREDARDAALFFVVCALCFLAALAALSARAAYAAADGWTERVAGQITVRVVGDDANAAEAERIAMAAPGIVSARLLTRSDAEALLAPWLGAAGVPDDLPLPHLIAAEAAPEAVSAAADLGARLSAAGLDVEVDDHARWSSGVNRATEFAGLIALVAVGLLSGTAIAVIAFATHAALLTRKDVVEVLHLTGARDGFISSLFERRFLMLGAQAGALGALLAFAAAAFILFALKQADDRIWLLPQLSLSVADGAILAATPVLAGAAAMLAARLTVLRSLHEMV